MKTKAQNGEFAQKKGSPVVIPLLGQKHPMYGPVIPGRPGLVRPVMAMSDSSTQRSLGLAGG